MVLPLADAFAHTTAVPYCSEAKNLLTTCSRDRLSFQACALAAWATQELSCATPLPSGQRKRPLANYPRGRIPFKLTLNNENTLTTQVPYAPEE